MNIDKVLDDVLSIFAEELKIDTDVLYKKWNECSNRILLGERVFKLDNKKNKNLPINIEYKKSIIKKTKMKSIVSISPVNFSNKKWWRMKEYNNQKFNNVYIHRITKLIFYFENNEYKLLGKEEDGDICLVNDFSKYERMWCDSCEIKYVEEEQV